MNLSAIATKTSFCVEFESPSERRVLTDFLRLAVGQFSISSDGHLSTIEWTLSDMALHFASASSNLPGLLEKSAASLTSEAGALQLIEIIIDDICSVTAKAGNTDPLCAWRCIGVLGNKRNDIREILRESMHLYEPVCKQEAL